MKVKIKGGDKLERLAQTSKKLKMEVVAGVFANATNSETHEKIAPYAAAMEYGTIHVPARPFLRQTVEKHSKEWKGHIKEALDIIRPENAPKMLRVVGSVMRADIRKTIMHGDFEPLNPKTIQAKRKKKRAWPETPLMATTSLEQSISFEVRRK